MCKGVPVSIQVHPSLMSSLTFALTLPNLCKGVPVSIQELHKIFDAQSSFPEFQKICNRLGLEFGRNDCEFWACEVRKTWNPKSRPQYPAEKAARPLSDEDKAAVWRVIQEYCGPV